MEKVSCTRCGNPGEFYPNSNGKPHRICKDCQLRYKNKRYATDATFKKKAKEQAAIGRQLARERYRQWRAAYLKGKSCKDCGNTDSRVLQFDHVRGKKKWTISSLPLYSIAKIEKEVQKCDVRCANCHTIRHFEERLA